MPGTMRNNNVFRCKPAVIPKKICTFAVWFCPTSKIIRHTRGNIKHQAWWKHHAFAICMGMGFDAVFVCMFVCKAKKNPCKSLIYKGLTFGMCGERGIRTPGASQHDGFQDRCNRPLYHLSIVMSTNFLSESECKGKQNYLYNIIFAVKNIPIYYLLTKYQQTN